MEAKLRKKFYHRIKPYIYPYLIPDLIKIIVDYIEIYEEWHPERYWHVNERVEGEHVCDVRGNIIYTPYVDGVENGVYKVYSHYRRIGSLLVEKGQYVNGKIHGYVYKYDHRTENDGSIGKMLSSFSYYYKGTKYREKMF